MATDRAGAHPVRGPLVPAVLLVAPGCGGTAEERGLEADHTTVWRWVQRYSPELEQRLRRCVTIMTLVSSFVSTRLRLLQEFQQRISDFAKSHPKLPWITGGGWAYSAFPNQRVDKKYIDAVITDRPVYVTERDGHTGLGNSKALQVAGITRATKGVPNGQIMREPNEDPTGELKEAAQRLMFSHFSHIPPSTAEDIYQSLLRHMDEAAADGLTSVQNASWDPKDQPLYQKALTAGLLKLHAIGDKAINMALNAFEYAAKTNGTQGRRHRVEHAEVPRLSDLPRFTQLGVIASTQALFATRTKRCWTISQRCWARHAPLTRTHSSCLMTLELCKQLEATGAFSIRAAQRHLCRRHADHSQGYATGWMVPGGPDHGGGCAARLHTRWRLRQLR